MVHSSSLQLIMSQLSPNLRAQLEPSRRTRGLSPRPLSPTSSNLAPSPARTSNNPTSLQHVHSPILPSEPNPLNHNISTTNPGNTTTISGSSKLSTADTFSSLRNQPNPRTNLQNSLVNFNIYGVMVYDYYMNYASLIMGDLQN